MGARLLERADAAAQQADAGDLSSAAFSLEGSRPKKMGGGNPESLWQKSMQALAVTVGKLGGRLHRWAAPADFSESDEDRITQHMQATARLAGNSGPLQGKALLFRSEEEPRGRCSRTTMGWSELFGRPVDVEGMPGDHHEIFNLPGARMMALRARELLDIDTPVWAKKSCTGISRAGSRSAMQHRAGGGSLMRPLEAVGFLLAIAGGVRCCCAGYRDGLDIAFAACRARFYCWRRVDGGILAIDPTLCRSGVESVPAAKKRLQRTDRLHWLAGTAMVCLLIADAAGSHVCCRCFRLPKPTGPYATGTRVEHLVDPVRMETHVAGPARRREIMVQMWYPATPNHEPLASYRRGSETTWLSSYMGVLRTHSYENAAVATSGAPFPVLLFNPAWAGHRTQNTYQVEDLASHGFIVVGIDHTYNSGPVAFPDGRVIRTHRWA